MRSVVYHIATSIDGFIAHPNGDVNGFLMDGQHANDFMQSLQAYDDVLMGRSTYEFGYQYGLKAGQPAYPNMEHWIYTKSLSFGPNERVHLIATDPVEHVKSLKLNNGSSIWLCGGGQLAGSLLQAGLVDELVVKINPIILGHGIKLFEGFESLSHWQLKHTKTYDNSVAILHYYRSQD